MDRTAKKTAIGIIVLLIIIIGYLWFIGGKSSTSEAPVATSQVATLQDPNVQPAVSVPSTDSPDAAALMIPASDTTSADLDPAGIKGIYTLADLKTEANQSAAAIHTYGVAVAKALAPYAEARDSDIDTMLGALNTKDQNKVTELLAERELNDQAIKDLLNVTVPKNAILLHLNLLNAIYVNSLLLNNMSDVLTNPVLALESADLYRRKYPDFFAATKQMDNYFKSNNVSFKDNEKISLYLNI